SVPSMEDSVREFRAVIPPDHSRPVGREEVLKKISHASISQRYSSKLISTDLLRYYNKVLERGGWRWQGDYTVDVFHRDFCKKGLLASLEVLNVSNDGVLYDFSVITGGIAVRKCE